ncbi:MAG: selenium metabolism-associated LysR family transcriptional regulator [Tissierellaceae bacterium]|nr:selenium metabolism-associated LysR family transcriptional regulator [Tissierellaceae bacterium]
MDFRQLESFIEVAKSKSFSKAAKKLFITQPTVTNHIQNLEKELDTILINRLGKTISLTEAGHLFLVSAIQILNTWEQTKFELNSYNGKIQGHINIFASSIPRNYLLPSLIKSFVGLYPDVTFSIGERDSKEVISSILQGKTNFGLIGARYSSNSLEYIDLLEDRLVLIAPNNSSFPQENFSYISSEILIKENIIMREEGSGTRALIESTLRRCNVPFDSLRFKIFAEDTSTIKELVSFGVGISLISEKAIKDDINAGKYKAFLIEDIAFLRKFYFVFHKNRQLSPLSEKFKKFVLEYIRNN